MPLRAFADERRKFLLEAGGRRILIDCGLFQGYKQLRLRNWAPLPFDPGTMEALMTVEEDSPEHDDEVAGVLQKGYRFKGQLLRPARVQVRKYHG